MSLKSYAIIKYLRITIKTLLDSKPSFFFDSKATYLIAGGLGGIGLAISPWMASRGAKNLLLLSRSGILKEGAIDFKAEIAEKGVRIHTPACNVADVLSLRAILEQDMQHMPPIKGCIQASVVMQVRSLSHNIFQNHISIFDNMVHRIQSSIR